MTPAAGAASQPLRITLDSRDNVAVVVNPGGLPAGTAFDDGLVLAEAVAQGHKVAIADIAEGDGVIRYGETIGYAVKPLRRGSCVSESTVAPPAAPALDCLSIATRVPPVQPPLAGFTFQGFRNTDGSVGTRNILGISTSVQCVAGVVDYVVPLIKERLLPRYPNVDDVVGLNHTFGCGYAANAPAAAVPVRTLQNLARNPNFGGEVLVVGLGCEKLQPEELLPGLAADDAERSIVRLQDERLCGFKTMVDAIVGRADERLAVLDRRRRESCPAADLVVGVQCGGSDALSGVTANPAVGFASDLLVRAGATVMFSEVTEVRDAVHLLTPRAINEDVGRALIREMAWYDQYLEAGGADRSANPTPGNKAGGLVNVVEKALGSAIKSGTSPITQGTGARGTGDGEGLDLRRDARERFHLRNVAAGLGHDAAGVHHRSRHALRPGRRPGDQGGHAQRPGRPLARPDRSRRRAHRDRRGDGRGGRLGTVPDDPRRRERHQEAVVGTMGPVQRARALQPRAGDVVAPSALGPAPLPRSTAGLVAACRRALLSAAVSSRSRTVHPAVALVGLGIIGTALATFGAGPAGQSQIGGTGRTSIGIPKENPAAGKSPATRGLQSAVRLVQLDSCDPAVLAKPPRTPKDMLEAAEWDHIRSGLSDYHAMLDAYADGDAASSVAAVLDLSRRRLARDWTGLTRALSSINTRGIDPHAPWDARRYALAVMLHTDAALRIAGETWGDEAFVQFQVAADLLQLGVRCAPGRFKSLSPRWYVALSRLLRDRTVLSAADALLELGRTRLENEPAIFGESGVMAESVATIYAWSQPETRTSWTAGDDRFFLRQVTDRRQAWLTDAAKWLSRAASWSPATATRACTSGGCRRPVSMTPRR